MTTTQIETLDFDSPVFTYLDELRESGIVNMFGAAPYLEAEFGLDAHTARRYLTQWMQSFAERQAAAGE